MKGNFRYAKAFLSTNVTIGSTKSDDIVIAHGVLQRSVLGPLLFSCLFLFFINDFSNCSKLFDFHIFADDTNLFYSNRSLTELEDDVFYTVSLRNRDKLSTKRAKFR